MSLIINADGEYLEGSGFAGGTNLTEASFGIWVKRDSGSSSGQSYACAGPDFNDNVNCMVLAHNGTVGDCFMWPANTEWRVDNAGNANSTAWQLLVLTYKKDVENRVYTAISGGSVASTANGPASQTLNDLMDSVRIGLGGYAHVTWNPRAKLAHCFFYNIALSGAQVSELFNGGTAGAGKNPQAVAPSNLKFYAPLTSDATVTVGGISLSATGTLTYDGAENPNVEAYGGGSVDGSATGANLTGTSSLTAGGASGIASGTANGANLTGTSSISAGAATGNATGSFTTAAMENNSGAGLLASTSVAWTWYESAIGSAPTSTTHGIGTTNGSGILTVTGLPATTGFILVTDGVGVYYQAGTPA